MLTSLIDIAPAAYRRGANQMRLQLSVGEHFWRGNAGIGDNGTVVGFFVDAAGNTIGTVGTPTTTAVPEPATLALLTAGLFGLGGLARRRRVR